MASPEGLIEAISQLLGQNQLLYALILFVIMDYITGVCVAIQRKALSSQIGTKGITKKIAMFIVIAFCHVLDVYLTGTGAPLESVATLFYTTNEGISILENSSALGVPLPAKLQQTLATLKKKQDEDPR